jgi:hypothetical protein
MVAMPLSPFAAEGYPLKWRSQTDDGSDVFSQDDEVRASFDASRRAAGVLTRRRAVPPRQCIGARR